MNRTHCPLCGSTRLSGFIHREGVPVHQNLVFRDETAARNIRRGTLAMTCCDGCGFVFNRAFDGALLDYGAAYDNTQSCSPSFDAYMDRLVGRLVEQHGVRGCRIVEIGCGKGAFLERLVRADENNTGRGFDPTYEGELETLDGRLRFERRFYDEHAAAVPADVVICRHVVEHIADPLSLLRSVRAALASSPGARLFFETPCVEWILRNGVVWDFFYEHCSMFTTESLSYAFQSAGFAVQSVTHVFGGQYLWLEAVPASQPVVGKPVAGSVAALARSYSLAERELLAAWERQVRSLSATGGVAVWGAGAKGVTFANLVDPQRTLISGVVDLNPAKQGGFLPGTGHPIFEFRGMPSYGVKYAILMNPNYRGENLELLDEAGLSIQIV